MTAAGPQVFAATARAADGTGSRPAPVMVGVDGSSHSIAALTWAARQAQATGARLLVVHAWQFPPAVPHVPPAVPHAGQAGRSRRAGRMPGRAQVAEQARADVESVLRRSGCDLQGGAVDVTVVEGEPGPTLVGAAREAALLVVGTRGHSPVVRRLLGSVSAYCTEHAPCTVVVVPTPAAAAAEHVYPVAAARAQFEQASIPRQSRAAGDDAAQMPASGSTGLRRGRQRMGNRR